MLFVFLFLQPKIPLDLGSYVMFSKINFNPNPQINWPPANAKPYPPPTQTHQVIPNLEIYIDKFPGMCHESCLVLSKCRICYLLLLKSMLLVLSHCSRLSGSFPILFLSSSVLAVLSKLLSSTNEINVFCKLSTKSWTQMPNKARLRHPEVHQSMPTAVLPVRTFPNSHGENAPGESTRSVNKKLYIINIGYLVSML